ncbi:GNAT family N-acetyltransferase [Rhizobium hainanense]|uniref:Ribosomal-protein-alanine N-acetyltransferase n=1 Tax=Rhizobium hainanense TaxID=52131 RepID=A0A1C3UPC5_9HYPH|nr:GNAT family N-acetyltransferase [Rhizobium hainanense]SCB17325.1 ribosomal-protein-alanine N-acetyltransferase [Rhizobium hainanense]
MMEKCNLYTERLHLRELLATDSAFVGQLITHEKVRRFLGGPVSLDQREAVIACYFAFEEGETVWLVETKNSRQPLGLISISHHGDGQDRELSYQFLPGAWGHGYAAEAAKRVLDYALKDLQLKRLIAETQSANFASRRLLERVGMRELRRLHRFGAEQIIYVS